jgi:hypothetical protein
MNLQKHVWVCIEAKASWPSGLRRYVQVVFLSRAGVQIPQMSDFYIFSLLFYWVENYIGKYDCMYSWQPRKIAILFDCGPTGTSTYSFSYIFHGVWFGPQAWLGNWKFLFFAAARGQLQPLQWSKEWGPRSVKRCEKSRTVKRCERSRTVKIYGNFISSVFLDMGCAGGRYVVLCSEDPITATSWN